MAPWKHRGASHLLFSSCLIVAGTTLEKSLGQTLLEGIEILPPNLHLCSSLSSLPAHGSPHSCQRTPIVSRALAHNHVNPYPFHFTHTLFFYFVCCYYISWKLITLNQGGNFLRAGLELFKSAFLKPMHFNGINPAVRRGIIIVDQKRRQHLLLT